MLALKPDSEPKELDFPFLGGFDEAAQVFYLFVFDQASRAIQKARLSGNPCHEEARSTLC